MNRNSFGKESHFSPLAVSKQQSYPIDTFKNVVPRVRGTGDDSIDRTKVTISLVNETSEKFRCLVQFSVTELVFERFEGGTGFDGLSRPFDCFSRHRPPIVQRIPPLCLSRNVAYDTRARISSRQ